MVIWDLHNWEHKKTLLIRESVQSVAELDGHIIVLSGTADVEVFEATTFERIVKTTLGEQEVLAMLVHNGKVVTAAPSSTLERILLCVWDSAWHKVRELELPIVNPKLFCVDLCVYMDHLIVGLEGGTLQVWR